MPEQSVFQSGRLPVVRSRLVDELRRLGVRPGAVLMVHARVSALGWVVGGTGTIVLALLDALGPDGTLMAYAGWEDDSYGMDDVAGGMARGVRGGVAAIRSGDRGGGA